MSVERSSIKAGVLYSGGKDSNYTVYKLSKVHGFKIECLIVIVPPDPHSMLFHHVNVEWTRLQAEALGLKRLEFHSKEDEYISLLKAVKTAKKMYGINALAAGGIISRFQAKRFRSIADELGLRYISPLWEVDQERYLWELYALGFKIIIDRVSALGLGREWLGRLLDRKSIQELIELSRKYRFNPSLEGGEGETFVLDMPLFKKKIEILKDEVVWKRDWGVYLIKDARLVNK